MWQKTKKWMLWIPVLIIIGFIVYFDLQSPEVTIEQTRVVQRKMVDVTLAVKKDAVNSAWILNKQIIRKGAHLIEYWCLGVTVSIAVMNQNAFRKKRKFCFFFCLTASLADQLLKAFLPTREFDFVDMIIDGFGYLLGIVLGELIVYVINLIIKNRIKQNT